jgi:FtsH-binding integral membrane protein
MMALIGVVLLGIINIFLGSSLLNTVLSIVGLIVFLGYTCYDINRLKRELDYGDEGKLAILGALSLFIDYINIVMHLLNLFGRRD